jgi:hypothetical protein
MLDWLKRVLGGSTTIQENKPLPPPDKQPVRERTAVPAPKANEAVAKRPSPPPQNETTGQAAAQQFLDKLQEKIARLADDFANGTINQQQFQKLYAHYQREMRAVETLIATDQGQSEFGDAFQEGESVLIRQQHAAKAKG